VKGTLNLAIFPSMRGVQKVIILWREPIISGERNCNAENIYVGRAGLSCDTASPILGIISREETSAKDMLTAPTRRQME